MTFNLSPCINNKKDYNVDIIGIECGEFLGESIIINVGDCFVLDGVGYILCDNECDKCKFIKSNEETIQ